MRVGTALAVTTSLLSLAGPVASVAASTRSQHRRSGRKLKDPTSLTPSFRGALRITSGSGRYNHAHGTGELYGVFHRRDYAIDMQAKVRLTIDACALSLAPRSRWLRSRSAPRSRSASSLLLKSLARDVC